MKRKIALGMIFVAVCAVVVISVSASMPDELSTDAIICNPSCGPFNTYCTGIETDVTRQHSFSWSGYEKTCEYTSTEAYIISRCLSCGSSTHTGMHVHSVSGHTPSICGSNNVDIGCDMGG